MEAESVAGRLRSAVHQNAPLSNEGLQERMFSALFKGLVYAQIWEDPLADMNALALSETDDVVCIASGSCNMMSYLTDGPASVTAVDLSPAHVALGRLKIAAAQNFDDHDSLYAFFGQADRADNAERYEAELAPYLDDATRAYWDARAPLRPRYTMFTRGFYRFGVLGRFLRVLHVMTTIARVDFRPLFEAKTLEDQQAFFDNRLAPMFENRFVKFLINRRASLFGLGIPPAQYEKLASDEGGDMMPVLKERLRKLTCDFPIKENYFAWQAFKRHYDHAPDRSVPPYLEAGRFEALKRNAGRAQILNESMTVYLANEPDASKDAYILLDAQDWMTDEQLTELWTEITRTARPGARVIFRTGGTPDILPGRVPESVLGQWTYDVESSAKGTADDRSAIYGGFHLYRKSTK